MFTIILTIHVLLAISLIAIILVQHGKGADAGAAFGSGSSGSVFGASGANSFLYKLTVGIAISFFVTSLSLAFLASNITSNESSGLLKDIPQQVIPETTTKTPETTLGDIPQ